MTLENARGLLKRLLLAQTYAELRKVEADLTEMDIVIEDDFVLTEERRRVLAEIRSQFSEMLAPTVVLTGWFGSGKTTLLHRIIRDLETGALQYGSFRIDAIEIRLNVQNTLSLFLEKILESVVNRRSEQWLVEVYNRSRPLIDLPLLPDTSARGVLTALMEIPLTRMADVVQFLEEVLRAYKRTANDERIIGLVIDELENVTEAMAHPQARETNKLFALLPILFDNSVREYIDHPDACKSPLGLIIFSITGRQELDEAKLLRQDSLDRVRSVEQNVNLSQSSAQFLMKNMLRIYFTSVLDALRPEAADPRLRNWHSQLTSAQDIDDPGFTYPIMPDVHKFFGERLLAVVPRTEEILRFRAYQDGLLTLLHEWEGEGVIDVRYMIGRVGDLRASLGEYHRGVHLNRLIGQEQVESFVGSKFRRAGTGQKFQLANVALLAITRSSTPIVHINRKWLTRALPDGDVLSEGAFNELLDMVRQSNVVEFDTAADSLVVDVAQLVQSLEQIGYRPPLEERLRDLLNVTSEHRSQTTVSELLREHLGPEAAVDETGVIHNRTTDPFAGTYFLAFDTAREDLMALVRAEETYSPAISFEEKTVTSSEEMPFEVTVLFPPLLHGRRETYANDIRQGFETWWDDVFKPLIAALVQHEGCPTYYAAFKEALKVIMLMPQTPVELRNTFRQYQRNLKPLLFGKLKLKDSDRQEWIRAKLGFARFHPIDATRRLVKVLSALEEDESLLYPSSDNIHPSLHPKFGTRVPLHGPNIWRQEVETEWEDEDFISDGRLVPHNSWTPQRKQLYSRVQEQLAKRSLSFQEVGRLLFGQARFDMIDKANVALHLFLKLGKVSPLHWELTDARHDYQQLVVRSGQQIQQQVYQEVKSRLEGVLQSLVTHYSVSPTRSSRLRTDIGAAIEIRGQMSTGLPLTNLRHLGRQLEHLQTSLPDRSQIDLEIIRQVPSSVSKLGEYLTRLNRLLGQDSALAYAVSAKLPGFLDKLQPDLACEYLLNKISTLYANWSQESPVQPSSHRMVQTIASEYERELGRVRDWHDIRPTECERQLEQKIQNIRSAHLEEDLDSIAAWLENEASAILPDRWQATYTREEYDHLKAILENTDAEIREEIGELANQVAERLDRLQQAWESPRFVGQRQVIQDHRNRLQGDQVMLRQLPSTLYDSPFGSVLRVVRQHVQEWDDAYSMVLQRQNAAIDAWLQSRALESLREPILAGMAHVNRSLRSLSRQMIEDGNDPLRLLTEGKSESILALFAAAQLLDALETETLE